MGQLPEVPQPVDHGVVGPEDRVEAGHGDRGHAATDPHMDVVVDVLQSEAEVAEGRCPQDRPDLVPGKLVGQVGVSTGAGWIVVGQRSGQPFPDQLQLGWRQDHLAVEQGVGPPVLPRLGRMSRRQPVLVRGRRGPVPPRDGHLRNPVLQRQLEEVQIGPVPGQEQDVPVPALDGQRQPMEPGVILVATLVAQPHHRQEGLPQRLDLRCRQGIDALSNSHGPSCGVSDGQVEAG